MPIHDWTRVGAEIFHHFHQSWIAAITDIPNEQLLPKEYHALAEQQGAGFEPDVLTFKTSEAPAPNDATGPPLPRYVAVPLEETYQLAFESVPRRWRAILDSR